MFDAVIFDCDGVLVDSETLALEIELQELAALGLVYERDAYCARFMGMNNNDFYAELDADRRALQGEPLPAEFRNAQRERMIKACEERLIEVPGSEAGLDVAAALRALGNAGLNRILVEGGAQLAASLLRADLVDRVAWFHAPAVMGGDAWPAVQAFGIERLGVMPRFTRVGGTALGDDVLSEFVRKGLA